MLKEARGHEAELVTIPFKWYPPEEIMRGALAWRLLDVGEANGKPIDLVVGMKFPAYVVAHHRKVLWVMHQYRAAYNLAGTPFERDVAHGRVALDGLQQRGRLLEPALGGGDAPADVEHLRLAAHLARAGVDDRRCGPGILGESQLGGDGVAPGLQ